MDSHHPHALSPGLQFGKYRIQHVLGTGGFAHTYLAHDSNLDRLVAIKELFPPDFVLRHRDGVSVEARSPQQRANFNWAREMFIEEGRTLARLVNPGIVQVYEIFEKNGTAYLVMAYIDSVPLERWLIQRSRPSEAVLRRLTVALLEALSVIHKVGYMHRDLHPDNVLMDQEDKPLLIDFGNARLATGEKSALLDTVVRPGYAPFEQYQKKSRQGPFTDLYSLGAVLYRAIVGEPPEDAISRKEEDALVPLLGRNLPGYSPAFLSTVDRALKMGREERWQSCEEWLAALRTGSRPPPPPPPPGKKMAVVLGVTALLLTGGGLAYYFTRPAEAPNPKVEPTPAATPSVVVPPTPAPVPSAPAPTPMPVLPTPTPPPATPTPAPVLPVAVRPEAATKEKPYINPLGMPFVPVDAGTAPGPRVLFCIYETRVQDFQAFARERNAGQDKWQHPTLEAQFENDRKVSVEVDASPPCPVVSVSYDQCVRFCDWLSQRDPGHHYRLPSSEEWSRAAGRGLKYPWGKDLPSQVPGNYADEGTKKSFGVRILEAISADKFITTAPVGSFPPNLFGLFDIGGNASELCQDNRRGWKSVNRVRRGGSWMTSQLSETEIEDIKLQEDSETSAEVGFRCVLELSGP